MLQQGDETRGTVSDLVHESAAAVRESSADDKNIQPREDADNDEDVQLLEDDHEENIQPQDNRKEHVPPQLDDDDENILVQSLVGFRWFKPDHLMDHSPWDP